MNVCHNCAMVRDPETREIWCARVRDWVTDCPKLELETSNGY